MSDVARRFANSIAEHEMTIAHDDGLYRHLKFRHTGKNYSGYYWFDLITVPGALFFQGDGEGFSFRRLADMFEFFRSSAYLGRPNVGYWAEKLTGPNERQVRSYSPDKLKAWVVDEVRQAMEDGPLPGLPDAVRRDVFEAEEFGWDDETSARRLLEGFSYYVIESDRYAPGTRPNFEFGELWEVDFRDYDWWFLWALEAILWGIGKYDEANGRTSTYRISDAAPEPAPELPPGAPAVVTAAVTGGVL